MDDGVNWLTVQSSKLANYNVLIGRCVKEDRWQDLKVILDERLFYLQSIFSKPLPFECREDVKRLIDLVLKNDTEFQNQIQNKKKLMEEQQLSLQRNCRALQSYYDLSP